MNYGRKSHHGPLPRYPKPQSTASILQIVRKAWRARNRLKPGERVYKVYNTRTHRTVGFVIARDARSAGTLARRKYGPVITYLLYTYKQSRAKNPRWKRVSRDPWRQGWRIHIYDSRGAFYTFLSVKGDKAAALKRAHEYRREHPGVKIEVVQHRGYKRSKGSWDRTKAKFRRGHRKWGAR